MLRKSFLIALAVSSVAGLAFSQPPVYLPDGGPFTGWGYDCTEWIYYDPATGWDSGLLIWNGQYYISGCNPVQWPNIGIELLVELEVVVVYDWTNVDIHLASFYDPFYIELTGYIAANCDTQMRLNPLPGYSMEELKFVPGSGFYGNLADPIPVTEWEIRKGADPNYYPMGYSGGSRTASFPVYQTYFWVRITVDPIYHQGDGEYRMEVELCPISEI